MENWIHNLDSFYVTKDDQKNTFLVMISSSQKKELLA